jgi:formylmethanofuran dehydrogenase subunit E
MEKKSLASDDMLCGRRIEGVLEEITNFHGFPAPGVVIGAFMVDWAQEVVGPGVEADAIVETLRCLPDAVQLFTPCTLGNGWMKVLDWDRFALTLYDRNSLQGVRVRLDVEKSILFPNIANWFLKRVPKRDLPIDVMLETIFKARREVLCVQPVRVTDFYQRRKKEKVAPCPVCREAYDPRAGDRCRGCRHGGYFEARPEDQRH